MRIPLGIVDQVITMPGHKIFGVKLEYLVKKHSASCTVNSQILGAPKKSQRFMLKLII